MDFRILGLDSTLLSTLVEEGYTTPTPIQTQAIPLVLKGQDLFGLAQTGTGKTAAFALPVLNRYLAERKLRSASAAKRVGPRCLVLTPTRELAIQVAESFSTYGRGTSIKVAVVFGGVAIGPQKTALRRRPEILVATPGRLLDLMGQGDVDLSGVDVFILDEADRMFDMGFIHDIRKVVAKIPTERQTLLFSATMPDEIANLAKSILRSPARVEVTPAFQATDTVAQQVYFVSQRKRIPLIKHLLTTGDIKRCIVFTQMKHVANRVAEALRKDGIDAEAFHSNKSQGARVRALTAFKQGEVRVLVATDIAARGLDVDDVEVVVNYDLPNVPETYVHRIGRAGRAGKTGLAWSLCTSEQRELLEQIERTTQVVPELVENHPMHDAESAASVRQHEIFREKQSNPRPAKKTSIARTQRPPGERQTQEPRRQSRKSDGQSKSTDGQRREGRSGQPQRRSEVKRDLGRELTCETPAAAARPPDLPERRQVETAPDDVKAENTGFRKFFKKLRGK